MTGLQLARWSPLRRRVAQLVADGEPHGRAELWLWAGEYCDPRRAARAYPCPEHGDADGDALGHRLRVGAWSIIHQLLVDLGCAVSGTKGRHTYQLAGEPLAVLRDALGWDGPEAPSAPPVGPPARRRTRTINVTVSVSIEADGDAVVDTGPVVRAVTAALPVGDDEPDADAGAAAPP